MVATQSSYIVNYYREGMFNMNIWLGVVTLIFILATALIIYIKQKNIRNVIWNIVMFIAVITSLYIGHRATQIWVILLCSSIIGACLLISVIHAFNKLFTSGKAYKSIGEDRKQISFGIGYWK